MMHDDDPKPGEGQARGDADAAACARVRELLAAAADLPLDSTQRAQLASHLATCGPCRAVASWMPRVDAAAGRSAPASAPTDRWLAQLKSRVMDQVRAAAAESEDAARAWPVRRGARGDRPSGLRGLWPAWPGFLRTPRALATLAVMALIGIFTYAEIRDRAVGTQQRVTALVPETTSLDAEGKLPPPTADESTAPATGAAPAATAPVGSTRADRADRVEVDAPAGAKLRATVRVDDQVALGHEQSAPAVARRQLPPEAPTALPLAKRETAAEASPDLDRQRQPLAATPQQPAQQHEVAAGEGQLEASHPAQPAPVGEPTEPTAAFDLRTAELPAAAVDSLAASPWDADRVRGALALVMQSRPPRDVEAAIGELLFALEDAPRPTKGFARSARRQPLSPPAALRAPDASSASRQTPEAAAQQFDAQGGVTTKDLVPRQTEATPSAAPAWSSLPATSAATSLVDSAAAALLLRMPELPDGAVRDRAVRWLQLQGLR